MKIELFVSVAAEFTVTIDFAANVRPQEYKEDIVIRHAELEVAFPHGVAIGTPFPRRTRYRHHSVATLDPAPS